MTSCADDYWDGVPRRCPRLRGGQTPTQTGSEPVAHYRKWSTEPVPKSLARLSFGPTPLGPVRQSGEFVPGPSQISKLYQATQDVSVPRLSFSQPSFRNPKSAIRDNQSPLIGKSYRD